MTTNRSPPPPPGVLSLTLSRVFLLHPAVRCFVLSVCPIPSDQILSQLVSFHVRRPNEPSGRRQLDPSPPIRLRWQAIRTVWVRLKNNRDVRARCQLRQACQRRRTAHSRNKSPTVRIPLQRPVERISVNLLVYKVESASAAGVRCRFILSIMDHL